MTRFATLTLAGLAVLLAAPAQAQTCTHNWTDATGGDWNVASNWDTGTVPGPTDDACITLDGTYTVTNNTAPQISVNSFTLGAASGTQTLDTDEGVAISAASTIGANGRWEWRIGALTGGATLTNSGFIEILGFFNGPLRTIEGLGTELVNEGTIDWREDDLTLVDDGALINNGTLTKSAGGVTEPRLLFDGADTGSRLFTNTGTISIAADAGFMSIDANSVQNGATLTVGANATLEFGGGGTVQHTFAGTTSGAISGSLRMEDNAQFAAQSGAVWDFTGNGLTWSAADLVGGETLTNAGLVRIDDFFNGELRTISGVGTEFLNTGTLDWTDDDLDLNDGALTNTGTITKSVNDVSEPRLQRGSTDTGLGLFTNTGTITIAPDAGFMSIDVNSRTDDGMLTVGANATLEFGGGDDAEHVFAGTTSGLISGALRMEDNAQFSAEAGAVWDFTGNGLTWSVADLVGGEALTNSGFIRIDDFFNGTLRTIDGLGTELINTGTIDWTDDDLTLLNDGALTNTGTITKSVDDVTIPRLLVGGTDTGSRLFTNTGTITIADEAGFMSIEARSLTDGATLTVGTGNATLEFGGGTAIQHTFAGTTSGAISGTLQIADNAQFAAQAGASWDFSGNGITWRTGDLVGGETLTNEGRLIVTGFFSGALRTISGAGTVLRNEGTMEWNDDFIHLDDEGSLVNTGLLVRAPGGITSTILEPAGTTPGTFTNSGIIEVRQFTLDINVETDHQPGGLITGFATFDIAGSAFTHDGDTSPGSADSTGVLAWNGQPWAPPASATYFVQIDGGDTPGDEYDQLDVNGAATIAGDLNIEITSVGSLSVGDTFTIIDASGGVTGTFSSITVGGVAPSMFSIAYNANTVVLTLDDLGIPTEFDVTLTGGQGWRTLANPYADQGLGGNNARRNRFIPGFLQPIYTAGYLGADRDQTNRHGLANVFLYDESTGDFTPPDSSDSLPVGAGLWVYAFADDDSFTPGQQGDFPKTLPYEGTPGTPPFPLPVTYTPGIPRDPMTTPALGFNLVGNPAASDLDWDDPNWTKTHISNVLYIYDPAFNGGDWRTWDGSTGTLTMDGIIPAGQGFHVEATAPGPELVVPLEALTNTISPVYGFHEDATRPPVATSKAASPQIRLALRATLDGEERVSETILSFRPEGTLGFDAMDARRLAGAPGAASLRMYAAIGKAHEEAGAALAVATLPETFEGVVQVPLGAEALVHGASADVGADLSWEPLELPAQWSATLIDRQSGQRYDLTRAGTASLHLSEADARTITPSDRVQPLEEVYAQIERDVAEGNIPTPPRSPETRALHVGAGGALTGGAVDLRFVVEISPQGERPPVAEVALGDLYPNPAQSVAQVELRLPAETEIRMSVFDMLGRRVADVQAGTLGQGIHTLAVPVASLAPGAYVLRLEGTGLSATRRLTIAR